MLEPFVSQQPFTRGVLLIHSVLKMEALVLRIFQLRVLLERGPGRRYTTCGDRKAMVLCLRGGEQ